MVLSVDARVKRTRLQILAGYATDAFFLLLVAIGFPVALIAIGAPLGLLVQLAEKIIRRLGFGA